MKINTMGINNKDGQGSVNNSNKDGQGSVNVSNKDGQGTALPVRRGSIFN